MEESRCHRHRTCCHRDPHKRLDKWTSLAQDSFSLVNKYYHFYAVCFGLSVGLVSYRPRVSTVMVLTMVVFFTLVFEVVGLVIDIIMGFAVAGFVAVVHNNVYYVCTLSYGMGIMTFAILGTIRKYRSLWEKRQHFY